MIATLPQLKICFGQINPIIGDFEGNYKKILNSYLYALEQKADIIILPELAICGYPPKDLLLIPQFLKKCNEMISKLIDDSKQTMLVIGTPLQEENLLFNGALVIQNHKVISKAKKQALPSYDIFDETRYFSSGDELCIFECGEKKLALAICEDLWVSAQKFHRESIRVNKHNPLEKLENNHVDGIISINASPFEIGKQKSREAVLKQISKKYHLPVYYINQVGGQDSLIFDGNSFMVTDDQEMLYGISFEEDVSIFSSHTKPAQKNESEIATVYHALIMGCRDYFRKTGFQKAFLGLSGGIDSAVVAALAAEALGNDTITGIAFPTCYSSEHSKTDAALLAKNLKIHYQEISIEEMRTAFDTFLAPHFAGLPFDLTEENIQARIRGLLLMAFSNKFRGLVLTTGNKSELSVGYCTLYGDMCGALGLIGDLWKTQVYELGRYINRHKEIIPENIFIKPPSAELKPNQTDQDTLPPYDILDPLLKDCIEHHLSYEELVTKGYQADLVKKILKLMHQSEYKRYQMPPCLKVSEKALGEGRRIPICQGFF